MYLSSTRGTAGTVVPSILKLGTPLLLFALSACTAPKSFIEMGRENAVAHAPGKKPVRVSPLQTPRLTDGLALNYADSAVSLLRTKYQGARVARQASSILQLSFAVATGASAAFGYSAHTISWLGIGSAGVPELQRIIDAKGRAQVYQDAVQLIEEAEMAFLSVNGNSTLGTLTPNGVILVQRVSASIHLVEKSLTGGLPTLEEVTKAKLPMRVNGTGPINGGGAIEVVVEEASTNPADNSERERAAEAAETARAAARDAQRAAYEARREAARLRRLPTSQEPPPSTGTSSGSGGTTSSTSGGTSRGSSGSGSLQDEKQKLTGKIPNLPPGKSAEILGKLKLSKGVNEDDSRSRLKNYIASANETQIKDLKELFP